MFLDISGHICAHSYSFDYANNITTFVKSLLCSHCESTERMTDEMPFYETVIANSKVFQKQDISSDLQDKINPVHPVNPVKK